MRIPIVTAFAIGVLMVVQWTLFLLLDNVPELQTAPWEIGFHLVAEGATAAALLAGGLALHRGWDGGATVSFVAFGMLSYTVLVSPGYFAQRGQWHFVAMFAGLLILAVWSIWKLDRAGRR